MKEGTEDVQSSSGGESSSHNKDDVLTSSSHQEPAGQRPQHFDSEDNSRKYRPHRTMFVSDQAHGKPPPSPSFAGGYAPARTSSQTSIAKRYPNAQRFFGDDSDPPSRSKGIGDSFHSVEDSRSTDDGSTGELDRNSGHSFGWSASSGQRRRSSIDSAASRASVESTNSGRRSVQTDSSSHNIRNEIPVNSAPMKAFRKSRRVDIPQAFLQKPDGDDASSQGTPRSKKEKLSINKLQHENNDDESDAGTPVSSHRTTRKGGRRPRIPPSPLNTPAPPLDPLTPRTQRKVDSALSLQVNFVSVDGEKDDLVVSTFNSLLEEIASSGNPQVQKSLNILATMRRNNITPDKRTWELIEKCARLGGDSNNNSSSNSILESSSEDLDNDYELPQSFDLYSKSPVQKAATGGDEGVSSKSVRRSWKAKQDLSQLPPAFRSSIMLLLRKENSRRNLETPTQPSPSGSQSSSEKTDRQRALNNQFTADSTSSVSSGEGMTTTKSTSKGVEYKPLNTGPSVSERKKRWTSKEKDLDISMTLPIKKSSSHDTTEYDDGQSESYQKHGVLKYQRPDGFGAVARVKTKSILKIDPETYDIRKEIEKLDPKSLENFHSLLQYVADSEYADKAKQAGIILKAMKEVPVIPDDTTRSLLAECSRIIQQPRELQVPVVDIEEVVDEEEDSAMKKQVAKKKVRFSDKNSTRIIRRRRSISSMERWDEPLTPPKRITPPVDLAPSRFSSGLRDHRPAPPRRSDSLSSLMSGGSLASTDSDTMDGTIDTYSESGMEKFKPPFVDSPIGKNRKGFSAKKPNEQAPVVARRVSGPRPQRTGDVPVTPVQRRGSLVQQSNSSPDPKTLSPAVPAPPVASPVFTTPPSAPRRKRRGSISGTEYRALAPLTPPRRVSAPLDIFIAQESLKATAKKEDTKKEHLEETMKEETKMGSMQASPTKDTNKGPKDTPSRQKKTEHDFLSTSSHSLPPRLVETPTSSVSRPKTPDFSTSGHSPSPATKKKAIFPQSPTGHSRVSAEWKSIKLPSRKSKKHLEMDTIECTSTSFDSADGPAQLVRQSSGGGGSVHGSSKSVDTKQPKVVSPWRAVKPKASIPHPSNTKESIRRVSSFVSDRPPCLAGTSTASMAEKGPKALSHLNSKFSQNAGESGSQPHSRVKRVTSLTTYRKNSLTNMSDHTATSKSSSKDKSPRDDGDKRSSRRSST